MLLRNGVDTKAEVARPGPYCDEMAVVLDAYWSAGDLGDNWASNGQGDGVARYGRRLFWWDDRGFLSTTREDTAEIAATVLSGITADWDDGGDNQ